MRGRSSLRAPLGDLVVGVFIKDKAGFIGIREKFGSRYLFMEYHYDTGAPYGTAQPVKKFGLAPDDIPLKNYTWRR